MGKLATLSARVLDTRTNQMIQNVTFRLQAKDSEHGARVMAIAGKSDINGVFTWQQQFFDGAPHTLQIEAQIDPNKASSPSNPSVLTLNQAIDVEGIAPPLLVRLITLTYMMAIVAIGLAIGFGIGKIQRDSCRLTNSLVTQTK